MQSSFMELIQLSHVVHSDLAAETLSICDGLDFALFLSKLIGNTFNPSSSSSLFHIKLQVTAVYNKLTKYNLRGTISICCFKI